MQSVRQVANAFLIAIASLLLVVGGLSLSIAEGGLSAMMPETSEATVTPQPGLSPTLAMTSTPEAAATAVPALISTPTMMVCAPPEGWVAIILQDGQTLGSIALEYNLSDASILQANCLQSSDLPAGTMIYVAPKPSQPVPTLPKCGPPAGWVIYVVKPGDTQYSIATRYRTTVAQLRFANCLSSSLIVTGTRLYVPNVATITPLATLPGILTLTFTPSATSTSTSTSTSTMLPTETPTDTPVPLADTDTPVPPTPTDTTTPKQ